MFFQCSKCKNVWQYPIEKCPQCFVSLQRMPSNKIKVRNICEVNISTILHPHTPYFVLLLEDENKNRWVQKSLEKDFNLEQNKNAVAVWRVKYDIPEAIEKILFLLENPQASNVLILPSLNVPTHPHLRENTSPEFLDALIKHLISLKVKKITVAGQSFDETPIGVLAQKSQLLSICSQNNIAPVDLAEGKFIKKDDLEISEHVFNNDLIINLPIMGSRTALSNLCRFIKKENYLSLEYLHGKEKALELLLKSLPEHLTLAEAISVQKKNKQTAYLGLVLGSYDCAKLDKVFNQIIMREEMGDIPVVGRNVKELQVNLDNIC